MGIVIVGESSTITVTSSLSAFQKYLDLKTEIGSEHIFLRRQREQKQKGRFACSMSTEEVNKLNKHLNKKYLWRKCPNDGEVCRKRDTWNNVLQKGSAVTWRGRCSK